VFPRNQYAPGHLEACSLLGLTHFRGNERAWFYAPAPGDRQTKPRRLCRLADSYINLSGANVAAPRGGDGPLVMPSSLSAPFPSAARPLDGLRLRRIEKAMSKRPYGGTFHFWHGEFRREPRENLRVLTRVLDVFR
jgi:hypothetical protein